MQGWHQALPDHWGGQHCGRDWGELNCVAWEVVAQGVDTALRGVAGGGRSKANFGMAIAHTCPTPNVTSAVMSQPGNELMVRDQKGPEFWCKSMQN